MSSDGDVSERIQTLGLRGLPLFLKRVNHTSTAELLA